MPKVTVTLSDDELDSLDAWALAEHGGDREAAMQALLDKWIDQRR
jgi:hypothetical protein